MKSLLSFLALAIGALSFQSCEVYPNATSRGYYGGGYYGGGGYYDGGYYGGGGYYDGGYYGGGGYGPTVVVSSGYRDYHHGYGYSNGYYDRENVHVNRNVNVNRNVRVNRDIHVNRTGRVNRNVHVNRNVNVSVIRKLAPVQTTNQIVESRPKVTAPSEIGAWATLLRLDIHSIKTRHKAR